MSDDTDASDNTLAMSITHGSGASYTFSSLTASTTYYFEIFSYTNSGSSIDYKTDGTIVTANATTGTTPVFVINEILADPDGSTGDANGDGTVSTTNDEFVEIINNSGVTVDISNWVIADGYGDRHTIASGTSLLDQEALVVFGGGTPTNINGHVFTASTGSLGLNNGGDDVTLKDASGGTIVTYSYGSEANDNQSIARDSDLSGSFVKHSTISATGSANFSPGRKNSSIAAFQPLNLTISGNSGFRMMSSPVAGQIYSDLLSELWTQGMTSADVTGGDANVWTYDGSSWSALSDITGSGSGASLTAGQGFLVYVFADTDNDGTDDLPVTLSVSGTENSSSATVPSSGSIANGAWELAGNPYASTIDYDLVSRTNVTTSCYVYDDATDAYKSWNGSEGSLSNGLIAPYQGFWVQGNGESGSITIETSDKSSTAGTFYKTMNDSTGSFSISISSGDYSDQTYVSFMTNGEEGIDNSDAYKLLPMTPTERIVGVSYAESNGLDINNLPYNSENSINFPLDIMYLTVDDNYNFVTNEHDVTMSWDISSLPETIIGLTLTNNTTGETTNLLQTDEVSFTTVQKGSFPAYGSGGVNIYPEVGESQFTLTIHYSVLSSEDGSTIPTEYALHQAYPNPFNPSTTITFDVPAETGHALSLQIFNVKGQLVETLINEQMGPGTHKAEWNPSNVSSGLYIVQMKAGDKTFNQKITFIK